MALWGSDSSIYENPLSRISRLRNLLLDFSNRIGFNYFSSLDISLLSDLIRDDGGTVHGLQNG